MKRSAIVEADSGPLGNVVTAANVPDEQPLDSTLDVIVHQRPPVVDVYDQHPALDKRYDNDTG